MPRRLPSGRWQGDVRLPGSTRHITYVPPSGLRRDVVAWEQEQRVRLRRGDWTDPRAGRVLFEDWCARWVAARHVEPETAAHDGGVLRRHVLPHWSGWPLAAVGRLEVQSWVTGMTKAGVGAPTVHRAYNLFASCLRAAVDEDVLARTPARGISMPTPPSPKLAWWEPADVELILAALSAPHWRCVAALMCWCGLRWEEAAGLAVDSVNWLRREVTVHQVVAGRRIKPYPKRAASRRTVRMAGPVAELLEPAWRAASQRPAGALPPGATSPLIWLATDGLPLDYRAWGKYWRRHIGGGAKRHARPAVPYHSPHVLRKSGASWLVQAGVPLQDVSRWLGHGVDSRATAVYAFLAPERSNATIGEALAEVVK